MLIEFTVGNYRSFKDPVTFSMVAAKLTARDKALDENNVFPLTDKISLLKSCAIYGANASGKSNLVQAFRFMRHFVLNSATGLRVDEPIDVDRFRLSTETEDEPSFFEIVFYADEKRYRYGFTVDKQKIHSECCYLAVMFHIGSEVHHGHAATPQLALERVAVGELLFQAGMEVVDGGHSIRADTRKNHDPCG